MKFTWIDYSPKDEALVESWFDRDAVHFTGIDEGFDAFYQYWLNDDETKYGENFWVKLIFSKSRQPVGIVVIGFREDEFTISELVIAPGHRGNGIGSAALAEFIDCSDIITGIRCQKAKAVIFPDNIASQKAFEKAGFRFVSAHPDGDAWYYRYCRQ